jgi:hypothetical protein
MALAKEYANIRFPYPELALTNMYLAAFFSGTFIAGELVDKFGELGRDFGNEEDCILLNTNYAGILVCAGLPDQALGKLLGLKDLLYGKKTDPYYHYYYYMNYFLVEYLQGNVNTAIEGLTKLEPYVSKVVSFLEQYYRKHYEIVLSMIKEKKQLSYPEMKFYFEEKCPSYISPIWNKFKFVYLFSDLQIWTSF